MILNRLQETICAKCDMSVNIDPGDQVIVRNLQLRDKSQGCTPRNRLGQVKEKVFQDGRWSPP